ncbi:MAG TPA: hypothetical protein VHP83_26895 [Aggregatilineaceae bacterium]|nr:hypothetical protein [Aggregatilineaceae bacterium]
MSYKLEKLPNEPITVYTALDFDLNELPQSDQALYTLLAKQTDMVYHVLDLTSLKLSFEELVQAAGHLAFGENATFRHPIFRKMVRGVIFVTDDNTISMSGKALDSDVYGNIPVTVFSSMESALQYIRGEINKFG